MTTGPDGCGLLLLLLLALATLAVHAKDYTGYHLTTVRTRHADDLSFLRQVRDESPDTIVFWTEPLETHDLRRNVTMAIEAMTYRKLERRMRRAGMQSHLISRDMQSLIAAQQRATATARRNLGSLDLNSYHRYDEIMAWVEEVAETVDGCSLFDLGTSYEGRPLLGLKIVHPGSSSPDVYKPSIWIDAGIHAREWIAPATALNLINYLLEWEDPITRRFDWYFLPVFNPDGYEYTWDEDRMWRKTRQPNNGSECIGTDANRNFDFHWMETGASDEPCSSIYAGPYPFSEPETASMSAFITETCADCDFRAYLTLHSYGQYILYPWGYGPDLPENVENLDRVASKMEQTIESTSGRSYTYGSVTHVLYSSAGFSGDWAMGSAGIPYSYVIELRGDDQGFLLPPDSIEPQGKEAWAAVRTLVQEIV